MRKKLFILILAFLLFFILSNSGWSKPWPDYAKFEHGWQDACKVAPGDSPGQQTYWMIKFSISPFFVIFKVMPDPKTALKPEGGNKQNVKFNNSCIIYKR